MHHLPGSSGGSGPAIVVDATYKRGFRREDLYQMLAYCVRLGLDDGHLVYAGGRPGVVRVPVPGKEIRLHRHVLLTEEVRDLATRVSGSLRSLDTLHVASALVIGSALAA